MAVMLDQGSLPNFYRTANLPYYDTAYTIMGWFYPVLVDGENRTAISIDNGGPGDSYDIIYILTGGTDVWTMEVRETPPATITNVSGPTVVLNQWIHIAMVRSAANSISFYANGALVGTDTHTMARSGPARMAIGIFATEYIEFHGRFAHVKLWTRALNAGEVSQEARYIKQRHPDSTGGCWPIFPNSSAEWVKDYSGLGRDRSTTGTITGADGPPIWMGQELLYSFLHRQRQVATLTPALRPLRLRQTQPLRTYCVAIHRSYPDRSNEYPCCVPWRAARYSERSGRVDQYAKRNTEHSTRYSSRLACLNEHT